MALFGSKKEPVSHAQGGPPTEQVLRFRAEGLSNNQIVQSLQRAGYRPDDIFTAMNQADLKNDAGPLADAVPPDEGEFDLPPDLPPQGMPPQPSFPDERSPPPGPGDESFDFGQPQAQQAPEPAPSSDERIEEIAEAIIDEKWQELLKDVHKIVDWKHVVEQRISEVETRTETIRQEIQSLHKSLFDRMDQYDRSVAKVGTSVKAMEEVFRKSLPKLSDNISDLSRITSSLKKKKSK